MLRHVLRGVGFLAIGCFLSSPAWAFQVQATAPQIGNIAVRWAKQPVTIHLQQDGAPSVTDGSDIRAIKAAFQKWSAPTCNNLQFDFQLIASAPFAGRKTDPDNQFSPPQKDGKSVVMFETKDWEFGDQIVAQNATFFEPQTGKLQETDLLFNAVHFKWSSDEKAGTLDIETVALARIGLMIGLWHSEFPGNVMHPSFDLRSVSRNLGQDDKDGSCWLYPTSGWNNPEPPKPKDPAQPTEPTPPTPDSGNPGTDGGGTTNPPNPTPDTGTQPPTQNGGCSALRHSNQSWGWLALCFGLVVLFGFRRRPNA